MKTSPKLTLTDNVLKVETRNSMRHSALLLYKLDTEVNKEKHELSIQELQAARKKFKSEFSLKLDELGIDDIGLWTIYWIDPDGTEQELKK